MYVKVDEKTRGNLQFQRYRSASLKLQISVKKILTKTYFYRENMVQLFVE
jgi:hypothetical protein